MYNSINNFGRIRFDGEKSLFYHKSSTKCGEIVLKVCIRLLGVHVAFQRNCESRYNLFLIRRAVRVGCGQLARLQFDGRQRKVCVEVETGNVNFSIKCFS